MERKISILQISIAKVIHNRNEKVEEIRSKWQGQEIRSRDKGQGIKGKTLEAPPPNHRKGQPPLDRVLETAYTQFLGGGQEGDG